jgi:hypothetical protein
MGSAGANGILTLALASAAACSAATKVVQPLEGEPPSTIAVLPPEGTLSSRSKAILRGLLGSLLADRNYAKLDDEIVDSRLASAGYSPWNPDWLPADEALASFGRSIGAEGLVLAEDFVDDRFSAGVVFRRGLTGTLRLLDARTGKTVWKAEVGSSDSGGVLLESGQVIRALSETIESGGEEAFGHLAANLALDAAEAFPPNSRPRRIPERPRVETVRVTRLGASASPPDLLVAGDTLEIVARGSAAARGRASIAGLAGDLPLVEEEPGAYRGRLRIEAGHGQGSGPVVVTLYDAFGNTSAPARSGSTWSLFAPRLDPPSSLTATVADGDRRRVRVRWEASPGAAAYLVARVSGGDPVTIEAGARLELEDVVPAEASVAFYVVSARSAAGAVGPPSAAASVRLEP